MFGVLKKKLSKAVKSISEKVKEKGEKEKEVVEKKVEEVEEKPVKKKAKIETPKKKAEKVEEKVIEKGEKVKAETEIEQVEERKVKKEVKKKEPLKPKPKKSIFRKAVEKVKKKIIVKTLEESDLEPVLSDLEIDLIEADVAVETAERIKKDLMEELAGKEIKRGKEEEAIISAFRKSLVEILSVPQMDLEDKVKEKKPLLLVFLGFNGSGKTTSIAKLANWLKNKGYRCVMAAADTFRAASLEQLEEHANKIGVKMIKHDYGADPAAVVYDAVEHAKAKSLDFVLADTAGRVHTNKDLMKELEKVVSVNVKEGDLKILVIDSLTGNDAVMQAKAYGEIGVDAVIFTKVDINEKGGAILSVTNELQKPILFLGVGQEYEDFRIFDAEKFVDNLLS